MRLSCALLGADELIYHAEQRLGINAGGTIADGLFSLHYAECQATRTEPPCAQVNYRYRMTIEALDALIDDRAAGALDSEIPPHGTLATVCQRIPADRAVGSVGSDTFAIPAWIAAAGDG